MADEVKTVAASIVNFLKQQLDGDALGADSRESVEVAAQCVETAFELSPGDVARGADLLQLLRAARGPAAAPRADAERLKQEGNDLMKAERHREALERYSRAIELDPRSAVYFCNRAAAHFKLAEHERAVADCKAALQLQPDYGKAHGRLGLALTALERHRDARQAFARAAQLEPDNDSYRQNLRLADERLSRAPAAAGAMDLGGLLQNPALLNMATEMMADPSMQNLISGLMSGTAAAGGEAGAGAEAGGAAPAGMSALLEAGQALAQHMQAANPAFIEQLRRQVRQPGPPAPPGGGGTEPPDAAPPS